MQIIQDIYPALPEIWLAVFTLVMLMAGVGALGRKISVYDLTYVAVATGIGGAAVLLYRYGFTTMETTHAFNGLFVVDRFASYTKMLILTGAGAAMMMAVPFMAQEKMEEFEFPILILFATLGMMLMISAHDLLTLYVGLELQALCLYVLAAFRRNHIRSSESGLKYFVLGALSSAILLYGISLIYGFAGTTSYEGLRAVLAPGADSKPIGVILGFVFIIAGMAFKISAVPFHMWTPDVYEGAPSPVTAFFAIAPKLAAIAVLTRLFISPFDQLQFEAQQLLIPLAILSMAVGAFGALMQTNIKRLMAYSSIGHMGYILVGLVPMSQEGITAVALYLAIYLVMTIGTFAVILAMRRQGRMVEKISDLAGLAQNHPRMALAMTFFMFSMAGIPPLAGFFGKYYVFLAAVKGGFVWLAALAVLFTVVSAYYYIRIVKLIYFDEPQDEPLDQPVGQILGITTALAAGFVLFFILHPGLILDKADLAAQSLTELNIADR